MRALVRIGLVVPKPVPTPEREMAAVARRDSASTAGASGITEFAVYGGPRL